MVALRGVALIPARAGSKRIPGKNVRPLGGHPLIAYTIAAARDSGVFVDILVSTESDAVASVARSNGAEVPFVRPAEMAGDLSPDIEWVRYTLERLQAEGREYDAFSLLRPTSPFRTGATIRRAWAAFVADGRASSLRAVELCAQHPGKMWVLEGARMRPLLAGSVDGQPWHSLPYQALPHVHVQNASLEIAWTSTVFKSGTIAGDDVMPFLTDELEGLDLNDEADWSRAEELLRSGAVALPALVVA